MSIEAMKQWLEALELSYEMEDFGGVDFKKYGLSKDKDIHTKLYSAITSLRQAIEQQEKQDVEQSSTESKETFDQPVGVVGVDVSRPHISYGGQYLGQQPDTKMAVFFKDLEVGTKLYTTPPHREWVGLTDEEVQGFADQYWEDDNMTMHSLMRAIEAKLKEKNT